MKINDVIKLASIRSAMYNTNVRSEPLPKRSIPHFTPSTYILLEQLRSKKPEIVDGEFKVKDRLIKKDGTYFTDQEEEEFYYDLEQYFDWMRVQEEKEEQERQ
jgi:hypothetical protein